jgi:hypothetical protein
MVTVSTVGYGDLTPNKLFWPDQIAVIMYALVGVAVTTESLGKAAYVISAKLKKMAAKTKERALQRSIKLVVAASSGFDNTDDEDSKPDDEHEAFSQHNQRLAKERFLAYYKHTLKPVFIIVAQLIACWSVGGAMLVQTEEVSFSDGFYCAVTTGLSIGYGEISPQTQEGRLCFCFFIPLSVTVMLGAIGQAYQLARRMNTIEVIQRSLFEDIFKMDKDDLKMGTISKEEYYLFMLEQMSEVDPAVLRGKKSFPIPCQACLARFLNTSSATPASPSVLNSTGFSQVLTPESVL